MFYVVTTSCNATTTRVQTQRGGPFAARGIEEEQKRKIRAREMMNTGRIIQDLLHPTQGRKHGQEEYSTSSASWGEVEEAGLSFFRQSWERDNGSCRGVTTRVVDEIRLKVNILSADRDDLMLERYRGREMGQKLETADSAKGRMRVSNMTKMLL